MKKYKMKWPMSRWRELYELTAMLNQLESLDNGNHLISRLQACMKVAKKMNRDSLKRNRQSFMNWLQSQAFEEIEEESEVQ